MVLHISLLLLFSARFANAACSATIDSLSDVPTAVKCTNITLNGFTVPAGQGLALNLGTGTTVVMNGSIAFGNISWAGPLFTISGTSVTFNGNGHAFNGGGPFYWDGQGLNGGTQKPDPMMSIEMSGTFENVKVVNSPARVFALGNHAALMMSSLVIDNSQGDSPNAQSGGLAAGHNTDGFDVAASDVTIQNNQIHNQDDCLAINRGTNIVFQNNSCTGGHGISIGSINSNVTVSGVIISGNNITNNDQALRIKTDAAATGSIVTNVTYSGNTATGIRQYGVIIDESYPSTLGTPGTGVTISDIKFVAPASTIVVNSGSKKVSVDCGKNACTGSWNWSNLEVTGGVAGTVTNVVITGFSQ